MTRQCDTFVTKMIRDADSSHQFTGCDAAKHLQELDPLRAFDTPQSAWTSCDQAMAEAGVPAQGRRRREPGDPEGSKLSALRAP
mmetsp:Transcript_71267/g.170232  ORF Transcript_71267/g.170232 Transcript_71267/m.170232 type:complete len:84 (+) Transcript_71267:155-406(+)